MKGKHQPVVKQTSETDQVVIAWSVTPEYDKLNSFNLAK